MTHPAIAEALIASQELLQFLWNNVDASGSGGNVDITTTDSHAVALANLLSDARKKVSVAMILLEQI